MKTLATTRFPTITPEALAALQARLGKPVRAARALHRGGDARRHPALGARYRRPQSLLAGRGRGAAHHPLRHGPHRVRLRGRAARHPRDVRGHRLPLGAADPDRRQDRRRERALRARSRSRRSSPSAPSSRSTARPSPTSAASACARRTPGASAPSARPRASGASTSRRARTATREDAIAAIKRAYATESAARRHPALLGRRDGGRDAARGGEGPAHRHLRRGLRAGLGQPLRARPRPGLRPLRAAPGAGHPQRLRRAGAARARALGRGARQGGGRARPLRLRPGAGGVARPCSRPTGWAMPASSAGST